MANEGSQLIDLCFSLDSSVDYWYDDGFIESRRRLALLSSDEWDELQQIWPLQQAVWQERLVYCLGGNAVPREIELLVEMFATGSADVSLDAASALREVEFKHLQSVLVSAQVAQGKTTADLLRCASVNEILSEIKAR